MIRTRRQRLLALCIAAMLGLLAAIMIEADLSAQSQLQRARSAAARLDSKLQAASSAGYTKDDLAPITTARSRLQDVTEPVWVGDRVGFYQQRASVYESLSIQLNQLETTLLQQSNQVTADQIAAATGKIADDQKLGADSADVLPLQALLEQLKSRTQSAAKISDVRQLASDAESASNKAAELGVALAAERDAIQKAADQLKAQSQGNMDAIRKTATAAIAEGRNNATAASWLKASGFERAYQLLERHAGNLQAAQQPDDTAFAAAAVQRYAQQIRDALMKGMPSKAVLISMSGQELWAYQDRNVVQDTLITTGRPPNLATDVGPMKVLWKQSPWKMHSPWPPGSPYWYPDTLVQMVVWFTNTGEGLHDASWQNTPYGPGSQYGPSASHGCIHIPFDSEKFLFSWAEVGTPVIIIPGDGTPMADQLKQKTVDDNGAPFTGPKGA